MSTPRRRQPRRVVDPETSAELAAIVEELRQTYCCGDDVDTSTSIGRLTEGARQAAGELRDMARQVAETDPCVRDVPRGVAPADDGVSILVDDLDLPDPAPGLARTIARAAARRRARSAEESAWGEVPEAVQAMLRLRIQRDDEMYRPHVNEEAENESRRQRDKRLRMVRCGQCSMKAPTDTCWVVRGYDDDATTKTFCCIDCMARWVVPRAGLRLHNQAMTMSAILDIIDECTDSEVLELIRHQVDNSLALTPRSAP